MNKFEKVSSDDYQMSLAGGGYVQGRGWVCPEGMSRWGWVCPDGVDMSGGYVKRDIPCDLPHDACNVIYHL